MAESTGTGDPHEEISIGLFGPRAVVRVMLEESAAVSPGVRLRPVGIVHDDPTAVEQRYQRLRDPIDAAVFPGPWWHDLARAEQWLSVPATHVPLSGAALYATLLRAGGSDDIDLSRVSVDSLSESVVREAYAEIGWTADQVHCSAYQGPESVAGFVDFHRALLRSGRSCLALTTILSVQRELQADGWPALLLAPTRATVREALETAVLLGQRGRLGAQQIAMAGIQIIPAGGSDHGNAGYWQQEVALSTQQEVLAEARRVDATLSRRSDTVFWVTTTFGGLEQLTDGLRRAPFIPAVTGRLGVPVAVGLGSGVTARAAEANAVTAMAESASVGGQVAVYLDDRSRRLELDPTPSGPAPPVRAVDPRAAEIAAVLAARVGSDGGQVVTDVGTVAAVMQVSERTGRRMLKELVEAGLAWPLPPVRSATGGRPRQQFRLLTEKLP